MQIVKNAQNIKDAVKEYQVMTGQFYMPFDSARQRARMHIGWDGTLFQIWKHTEQHCVTVDEAGIDRIATEVGGFVPAHVRATHHA